MDGQEQGLLGVYVGPNGFWDLVQRRNLRERSERVASIDERHPGSVLNTEGTGSAK